MHLGIASKALQEFELLSQGLQRIDFASMASNPAACTGCHMDTVHVRGLISGQDVSLRLREYTKATEHRTTISTLER